jgi:hypothetical protein
MNPLQLVAPRGFVILAAITCWKGNKLMKDIYIQIKLTLVVEVYSLIQNIKK